MVNGRINCQGQGRIDLSLKVFIIRKKLYICLISKVNKDDNKDDIGSGCDVLFGLFGCQIFTVKV